MANPPPMGNPNTPFDWLTHLDRPVVNSLELLQVSGFHPHELSRQFVIYDVNKQIPAVDYNAANDPPAAVAKFAHRAPWTNEPRADIAGVTYGDQASIFRALELLGVPSYQNGTTMGGRVPGKININTLNELEILLALADPQINPNFSNFTVADISALLQNLRQSRMPGDALALPPIPPGQPWKNDVPFKSFATAWVASPGDQQYPNGSGIQDTLLRNFTNNSAMPPTTQPLFWNSSSAVPGHPYQKWELLQKIYNNLTTTSNVFAVWLTCGFFEVQDVDAAGNAIVPPKIGSEIGRDQGRQVRHRMFAIIDRTEITLGRAMTSTYVANNNPQLPGTLTVTIPPGSLPWGGLLQVGNTLLLEASQGANSEVVVATATAVTAPTASTAGTWTFSALPQVVGSGGLSVTLRGNPGPWTTPYNHRSDPLVVPHYTVIQ
jgi:hypothetical protein